MISLVLLGGDFHLRSTWKTYCEEMRLALGLIQDHFSESNVMNKISIGAIEPYQTSLPMTHHERKYCNVGLPLYQLNASLGTRGCVKRQELLQEISQQAHVTIPPNNNAL